MARPLCLYFLLCRINTAIPPPSQDCPDKGVRQFMSSAGKSVREPGLQVQPWLHHPEQPSTRRPSGSPRKAKYTGLGVEADLTLLEGLSASHSAHPQWLRAWQGLSLGCWVSRQSWRTRSIWLPHFPAQWIPSVSST